MPRKAPTKTSKRRPVKRQCRWCDDPTARRVPGVGTVHAGSCERQVRKQDAAEDAGRGWDSIPKLS